MNRVDWLQQGGVPIRSDDWHYEQQALAEALRGITSMIGEHYHLSGVQINYGWPVIWTDGFIVLGGEVYFVPAGSTALDPLGSYLYFEVVESNDPSGEVILENNNTAFIHKRRVARIRAYTSPQPIGPNRQEVSTVMGNSLLRYVLNTVQTTHLVHQAAVSWRQSNAPLTLSSAGFITINNTANAFRLPVQDDDEIKGITGDSALPNGTEIVIAFEGIAGDFVKIHHGNNLIVPGAGTAVFHCNGTVKFIKIQNHWRLLTKAHSYL